MKKPVRIVLIVAASVISLITLWVVLCNHVLWKIKFDWYSEPEIVVSVEVVDAGNSTEWNKLAAVPDDRVSETLEKMRELPFHFLYYGDPNEIHGTAIRVVYADGTYDMITYSWSEHIVNGEGLFIAVQCGEDEFKEFTEEIVASAGKTEP